MNGTKFVQIETTRSVYTQKAILDNRWAMSLEDLIDTLEDLREELGGEAKVVLSFDNGYTYGGINEDAIRVMRYNEDDDERTECDEY